MKSFSSQNFAQVDFWCFSVGEERKEQEQRSENRSLKTDGETESGEPT